MKRKIAFALMLALVLTAGFTCFALAGGHPTVTEQKTGVTVYQNAKARVDASNLSEGYLLISYTGGQKVRTRVQIAKTGGASYLYEINNGGAAEVYPLTEGDGSYTVKVFESTASGKYAAAYTCTVELKARDFRLPFLYPNQYVNYTGKSQVVTTAADVTKGCKTELEKVEKVYQYVIEHISYDYELAKTVQSGYLPNVDGVLAAGKGICFDYAAVMTAMLRSQNIPCKLVIGYAGTTYHAWINVYLEDKGWVDQIIYFDGASWTLMDPTFISSGKGSQSIQSFVTNPKNYTQKFAY